MIRIGFVGFGRMGITHLSILNTHPSVKVAAVCDQSGTMLKLVGKHINLPTYTDYRKMIDEAGLDCVVISTPTDSHGEVIKSAIDKNLHIFVEKPFTLTAEEGQEVLAHLGNKPLVNQVGYVNRFNEVFMEVKRLLNAGIIGDVKNIISEMYSATVLKDTKSGWRSKKTLGGGCLYECASHCIDLTVYLAGQPDRIVGSIMQSIYSSEVEDLVSSTFIYRDGGSGAIMVNWSDETYRKPVNILKIFGTGGRIIADKHAFKVYLKKANEANSFEKGWTTRYITDFGKSVRFYLRGNEFTRQLDYFVDCVERGARENISSFAEALKTDIIMGEITKDAARSLNNAEGEAILQKNPGQKSLWTKLFKQ
jgi:predicted dehydrogenase